MDLKQTYILRGRSPRVRGSQDTIGLDVHVLGSIPARAGEPLPHKGLIYSDVKEHES